MKPQAYTLYVDIDKSDQPLEQPFDGGSWYKAIDVDSMLEKIRQEVEERVVLISMKNKTIIEQSKLLVQKDQQLDELRNAISGRIPLADVLAQKDEEIADLKEVRDYEGQLSQKFKEQVKQKEAEIEQLKITTKDAEDSELRISNKLQLSHENCACDYDQEGDVCMVHYPAKTKLDQRVSELELENERLTEFCEKYVPREETWKP